MNLREHSLTAAVALALGAACTNTYIADERYTDQVPGDRVVAIEGQFCTPATSEVLRPLKVVIAMDASQSMRVSDPTGTRAQAIVDLLDVLPREDEVFVSTLLFTDAVPTFLTRSGLMEFEQLVTLSTSDRLNLKQRVLAAGTGPTGATDFLKPLAAIYELLNRDIAASRARGDQAPARYSVIFLSDGQPTINQDDELLCGDAVRRIRQLKDLADDVRFNTVHVFLPVQSPSSACLLDGGVTIPGGSACLIPNLAPGSCPMLITSQNAERLRRMAQLGGGDFRDFRNNEPINFLNFSFGNVRRAFVFDKLIATNFSSPPGSPLDRADTDSDGLLDDEELVAGTSPWVGDTDGDGFSDGVEVYFAQRGAGFSPNQVMLPDGGGLDPGCPPALRGVDSDCDGLGDCDEQFVGSDAQRIDTDNDGVPDSIEWQLGTQPSAKDLDRNPDSDQLDNGQEIARHTDPFEVDTERLSGIAYRYELQAGAADAEGRQCFTFRVDNVSLAQTLADPRSAANPDGGAPLTRRGAGFNDLMVSVSMRPGDDPDGRTMLKTFRSNTTRYPVGGIRSPVDGIVRADFGLRCR